MQTEYHPTKAGKSFRQRTLTWDIIVVIIITVVFVSVASLIINLVIVTRQNERKFNEKSEEILAYLRESLEIPLWNYDYSSIEKLGRIVMSNDIVTSLRIRSNRGEVLFADVEPDESASSVKHDLINYHDQAVGSIEIGLTNKRYEQQQKQIVRIVLVTGLAVILSIAGAVILAARRFLKKPLQDFSGRIESIAGGDYHVKAPSTPYGELESILERFNQMALRIRDREASLETTNQTLRTEIEERKKIEKLLRESEQRFRSLNDNVPVGVFRTTPDGEIVSYNPAFRHMLKVNDGSLAEFKATDFYQDSGDRNRLIRNIYRDGKVRGFECYLRNRENERVCVSISARGVRDENGDLQYIDGIAEDITARKDVEFEKNMLEQQLRQSQKLEAIGTLAGGIAHDFNNILGAIIGYTELVQLEIENDSPQMAKLNEVLKACGRAKDLVNQILTFSRQSEREFKPVQVSAIAKETLKLLRASLPTTIEIRQHIHSHALVTGDPTQLHQLFMNLCTNAAHAMNETGGLLEVYLDQVALDADRHSVNPDLGSGEFLKIVVKDTGKGIPPEIMDRIFEPFFTTKDKGEGTGMGLAVVHGIIQSHDGHITVTSKPDQGTAFEILLPVIETSFTAETAVKKDVPRGTEHILLVDDEHPIADIGKRMLESLGYKVSVRTSSAEALGLFRSQAAVFDLVITDMTMPQMTGDKLAAEMKIIRPDIPIILCTGFSYKITEEMTRKAGIKGFLMKPILREKLAETVREVLDQARG